MYPSPPIKSRPQSLPPLEMWGGMECTVNRVGDHYSDQTLRSGHQTRFADLDLIAELGIRALRYPVIWERVAPRGLPDADWRWTDARLRRLCDLNIRPIAGLLHHGSGPRDTSLVDPAFPRQLAAYAAAVAQRYPWLSDYTPVNEPLTTARFSGLYGHWYPHGQDALVCMRILLAECRAVVESMRVIRQVNPAARLIQTDDLGKTYSTPRLAYQAEFENERRWLTWDLLCGTIDRHHTMWPYLTSLGIQERELGWFLDNPCPPDIIGINHYITSERVLDEQREPYPADRWGGNQRETYADMEAVRARLEGIGGWRVLGSEAWERYRRPIAFTEVHMGSSRDEQLRWLLEAWRAAVSLRDEDAVDVKAVTTWSLFGAFDWNHLVTCAHDFYEPGAFDLRAPAPRPTALAGLIRDLARGRVPKHPLLDAPGWWRRADRLQVRPLSTKPDSRRGPLPREWTVQNTSARPVAITGATGTLGRAFARICKMRGIPYRLLNRQDMDIADPSAVQRVIREMRPWAVINTAGYVRVDDAEADEPGCMRENRDGAVILAAACAVAGVRLVTFSSDLVFDGGKGSAYVESDPVTPLNVYGRSKAEAERQVLAADPCALVIRTSAFFGPWDAYNFVSAALRNLSAGEAFDAADDTIVSPTYVPDLVQATLDLLIDAEYGLWHLANDGAVTWADFARQAARTAGVSAGPLRSRPTAELGLRAVRPVATPLASERGWIMPGLEDALTRFVSESAQRWSA